MYIPRVRNSNVLFERKFTRRSDYLTSIFISGMELHVDTTDTCMHAQIAHKIHTCTHNNKKTSPSA